MGSTVCLNPRFFRQARGYSIGLCCPLITLCAPHVDNAVGSEYISRNPTPQTPSRN